MEPYRPLLLDTHTLLWYFQNGELLPAHVRSNIADAASAPLVSMVIWWEMSIKAGINKLQLPLPLARMHEVAQQLGFVELPISFRHVEATGSLPHHHRDPFDRLLIAQALTDDLTLVSRDPKFDAYGVRRLW